MKKAASQWLCTKCKKQIVVNPDDYKATCCTGAKMKYLGGKFLYPTDDEYEKISNRFIRVDPGTKKASAPTQHSATNRITKIRKSR